MHTCPVATCTVRIPDHLAMCREHWFMVPATIRQQVWTEYKEGQGSEAHLAALGAATECVNRALTRVGR